MHPESTDWPRRVAILGVGLLGGSVGMCLRQKLPRVHIVGTSRSAQRRQTAIDRGAVDQAVESIDQACQGADVVVVASTVDQIANLAIQAARVVGPECLITDVGSTKDLIVRAVRQEPNAAARFVAAHPIAGSEKTGVENSTADLFLGKPIVLTPDSSTDSSFLAKAECFWQTTGGRTITMGPAEHDTHLAAISHVPHLVSALVARLAPIEARPLVGSGWRDITRVAAGDPAMWTAICQANRPAIAAELSRLAEALADIQRIIDADDAEEIQRWLAHAQDCKTQTP